MIKSRKLARSTSGYFAISLLSTSGLFLPLFLVIRDVSGMMNVSLDIPIIMPVLVGLILSISDYLVAIFLPTFRRGRGSSAQEITSVFLFILVFIYISQFIRTRSLSVVPDANSIFIFLWGFFFWLSQSELLKKFIGRIQLFSLIEGLEGKELNAKLQSEQSFVISSYQSMESIRNSSIGRQFALLAIILVSASLHFPLQPAMYLLCAAGILTQLLLASMGRMYAEDHHYLGWGALPSYSQRQNRSAFFTAFIITAALFALPFSRPASVIDPLRVLGILDFLFTPENIEESLRALEQVEFLNYTQPINPGPSSFISPNAFRGSEGLFVFLRNLLFSGIIVLFAYFLIVPFFRDNRMIQTLSALLKSRNFKSFLRELSRLGSFWIRGFGKSVLEAVLFPYYALRGLFNLFKNRRRFHENPGSNQAAILNKILKRETMSSNSTKEKKRELSGLSDLLRQLVECAGLHGLEITSSDTIRKIFTRIHSIMESIGSRAEISLGKQQSMRDSLTVFCKILEEAFYSDVVQDKEALKQNRGHILAIVSLLQEQNTE